MRLVLNLLWLVRAGFGIYVSPAPFGREIVPMDGLVPAGAFAGAGAPR